MAIAVKIPQRLTTDEFLAMPGHPRGLKLELVDGEVVTMSPANAIHGLLQSEIAYRLRAFLEQRDDTASVLTEAAVVPRLTSGVNVRVPDIAVTLERIDPAQKSIDAPLAIIEVLSLHNERSTRSNVLSYASIPSVQQIALFSSTRIEAELLLRQPDGHWPKRPIVLKTGDDFALPAIGFSCPVDVFYARTSIRE